MSSEINEDSMGKRKSLRHWFPSHTTTGLERAQRGPSKAWKDAASLPKA